MSLRASKVDDPQVQRNLNAIYDELNRLRALTANLSGVVESTSTVVGGLGPPGGSTPSGTGFRHVTAGTEDAAAALVINVDVDAAAGIVESKLALNNPTHSNANDPSAGQKQALAGTSGVPATGNEYVTTSDSRLANKRAPTIASEITDDIMRFGGTDWVRVAKGGNNTVLGVDGSGVLGYKADPGGGSGLTHPQVLARGFARC